MRSNPINCIKSSRYLVICIWMKNFTLMFCLKWRLSKSERVFNIQWKHAHVIIKCQHLKIIYRTFFAILLFSKVNVFISFFALSKSRKETLCKRIYMVLFPSLFSLVHSFSFLSFPSFLHTCQLHMFFLSRSIRDITCRSHLVYPLIGRFQPYIRLFPHSTYKYRLFASYCCWSPFHYS